MKHLGPNWFAAVMGTGIVANAAITLPVQVAGQRGFALAVWVAAAGLLLLLLTATGAYWLRHPQQARAHIAHPVVGHFYGTPPMAMLTVGAGALLVGRDLIEQRAAVDLDWALWTAGTVTGLLSAAIVPYFAFTRHDNKPERVRRLADADRPTDGLSQHRRLARALRRCRPGETLLLGCYVMFGLSLLASLIVTTLIWGRLTQHKVGAAAAVPTLWIVQVADAGPLDRRVFVLQDHHVIGDDVR